MVLPVPGRIESLAERAARRGDRWFPSSKTCSSCGAVKAKLPLRVRRLVCQQCGLSTDRDENAAINLLRW
ncbi:zinc ribbon domain-containing protein [Nonomuraea diastatica]|uniref:zinc ribbon domain-containing protein n=1 Tax=Nonomuraea diastatica TaxID=1848329 RepID=UPI0015F2C912